MLHNWWYIQCVVFSCLKSVSTWPLLSCESCRYILLYTTLVGPRHWSELSQYLIEQKQEHLTLTGFNFLGYLKSFTFLFKTGFIWIFDMNSCLSARKLVHSDRKCCLVSGAVWQSLHVGFTLCSLNVARLPWRIYVPVMSLHFTWALLLSIILHLTEDQTGWLFPTFRLSGLTYFKKNLLSTSDFYNASMLDSKVFFHFGLEGCSSNKE